MALKIICLMFLLPCPLIVRADSCSTADLTLANGQFTNLSPNSTHYEEGETISVCCNDGYVRIGPDTLTCLSSGQFSELPTCQDINECSLPPPPSESVELLDLSSSSSYGEPDGDRVTAAPHPLHVELEQQMTCQGRGLTPPPNNRCHAMAFCENTEGSFSCSCLDGYIGNGTYCKEDDSVCEAPSPPDNGYFRLRGSTGRMVSYGCREGYNLVSGCEHQVCREGRWVLDIAGSQHECQPARCVDPSIRCPVPVAPSHGHIIRFISRDVGSVVLIGCEDGYDLHGNGVRVCLFNGIWSGLAPRCRPKKTLADVANDIKRDIIDQFSPYSNTSTLRLNLARSANIQSIGLDVVLAFDRSSSIREHDFQLAVNFTKQFIAKFGVSSSPGGTRVAALTFASVAEIAFNFCSDVDTQEEVFIHLDSLKDGLGGGTGLKEGLEKVALEIQPLMRNESKRLLFIFTDGQHNTADPMALALDLKRSGMEIFAVGVGSQINGTALSRMASYPASTHFFHIRTFNDLEALTRLVSKTEVDYSSCGEPGEVRLGDTLRGNDYQSAERAWPWLSIIHVDTPNGKEVVCSGTLLCRGWILTAASCFDKVPNHFVSDMRLYDINTFEEARMTVTLGEHDTSREEGCEQVIEAGDIIQHEQYILRQDDPNLGVHGNHDYDIALLQLNGEIELNSCARTTCLPSESLLERELLSNCFVVGWGTGEPAHGSNGPLQFPMPIASQDMCRDLHSLDNFDVTSRMLCAGERSGLMSRDARCHGGRGSPLMCQREDGQWVVNGVSSLGETCSRPNRFGIFTKITPEFLSWINSLTGNCTAQHIPQDISFN